jgi:hypothetical protein
MAKVGGSYMKLKFPLNDQLTLEHYFYMNKDSVETWTVDETLFKTIDKKELILDVKKSTLGIFKSTVEEKKFKMSDLGSKCEHKKEITFGKDSTCTFIFAIRQPLKGKEYEEVPTPKLVIDTFIKPFREIDYVAPTA